MGGKNEIDIQCESSRKGLRHSCFALIPTFNWKRRRNNRSERQIIRIIQNSNIFKSNPVLKTLIIENIRICCVVIETSGKQSVKILCASAPYILALISNANPKLEKFLKSDEISQCFSIFQCDLELLLSNGYQTALIIHRGLKKCYYTFCVSFIKDSFLASERSLLYLFDILLYVLRISAEYCMDNIGPFINYLYHQHSELTAYIFNYFCLFISSAVKASVIASIYSKKAVIVIFKFIRHVTSFIGRVVDNVCKDSAVSDFMKKLCLYLKFYMPYLRSTKVCNHFVQKLSYLLYASKPFLLKYFSKTLTVVLDSIRIYFPLVKDYILYAFKKFIPLVKTFIEDNLTIILKVYHCVKSFLSENKHHIKSLCCHTCRFCYSSAIYLYHIFQTILPHVIQISTTAANSLIAIISVFMDYCLQFLKMIYNHVISIWENRKELFCRVSRNCIIFLKRVYEFISATRPRVVLIFRIITRELTTLIHSLASTSLTCLQEVNASLLSASREVVSKSCLAVKHTLPSFYLSARTVVPPTVRAAYAVIKSSSNSVLIVYPVIFDSIVKIHPELEEGMVVLCTDGSKACLAVVAVSFAASCELKVVARTVSKHLPVFLRAVREVLITTSYAAIEVSATSFNAKKRMLKDFKRAQDIVFTSFLLAEQEITMVYTNTLVEINTAVSGPSKKYLLCVGEKLIKRCILNSVSKLSHHSLNKMESISKFSVGMTYSIAAKAMKCSHTFIRVITYIYSFIFFLTFSSSSNILLHKFAKNVATLVYGLYITAKCGIINEINHLYDKIGFSFSEADVKIKLCVCRISTKLWFSFKSFVRTIWNAGCLFVPQLWAMIVNSASKIWAFSEKNIPEIWIAWKKCCYNAWMLINELSPYVWLYFSSVTPVIWSTIRTVVQKLWSSFIESTVFFWHHVIYLSSTNWMLSNTYLPCVWFTCCAKTRRSWELTCCVIETCWTLTVESFLLSWKFLHHSVAKSWSSGLLVTKTAYFVFSASRSVLHKSFCLCIKTRNRVYVLSNMTFRMKSLTRYSFDFSKIRETLPYLSKKTYQCDFDDADIPYSSHLRLSSDISNYINNVLNFIPYADKILNCKTYFFPKKYS